MSEAALAKRSGRKPWLKGESNPWTEAEEARLLELRKGGATMKQCAAQLGRTRESVIGKMDRISGRLREREEAAERGEAKPVRRVPISLAGPVWSRPERYQS